MTSLINSFIVDGKVADAVYDSKV